jgi:hypothetical protein
VTVMIMVINYCPFCDGDDNDDKLLPFCDVDGNGDKLLPFL